MESEPETEIVKFNANFVLNIFQETQGWFIKEYKYLNKYINIQKTKG